MRFCLTAPTHCVAAALSLPAEQGEDVPLAELMRQMHELQREAIATLEAAQQRRKNAGESLRRTLQVGEAARAERIQQKQREATAAAAEAAQDQRASQAATSRTLAGVRPCMHAGRSRAEASLGGMLQ